MRKQTRALIVLTVVLFVIIALTVHLALYNSRQTRNYANEIESSALYLGRLSDPVYISYNCGGADFVSEFILEDGVWYCAAERDLPLNQDHLSSIAELIPELTATRKLEKAENLDYYGLERPAYTFTAKDASGTLLKLFIGNKLAGDQYYALSSEEGVLYTIEKDLPELMGYSLYDLSVTDIYDILLESNMHVIEITGGNGAAVRFEKVTTEDAAGGKAYVWSLRTASGLVSAEDFLVGGDGVTAKNYIDAIIKGFERSFFYSCVDYNCTDAQLSNYGLSSPIKVTVIYTAEIEGKEQKERTLVFLFGKQFTETSEIYGDELLNYAMLEGGKAVNCMTARRVTPFSDALSALGGNP